MIRIIEDPDNRGSDNRGFTVLPEVVERSIAVASNRLGGRQAKTAVTVSSNGY